MTMDAVVRWATKLWTDSTEVTARPTPRVSGSKKAPPPRRALRPARLELTHPVASALLAHAPSPSLSGGAISRRPVRLDEESVCPGVRLSDAEQATGWLFGVFFDHMIPANQAWQAPYLLAERLGHLDVRRIARMNIVDLQAAIVGTPGQKALHRLHPRLAKNLHAASVRLVAEYGGNVENIWPDGLCGFRKL